MLMMMKTTSGFFTPESVGAVAATPESFNAVRLIRVIETDCISMNESSDDYAHKISSGM